MDMARNLVLESKAYRPTLQPEILEGSYNQEYEMQLISENVANLLKDGIYLKHEVKDRQVFLKLFTGSMGLIFFYPRDEQRI